MQQEWREARPPGLRTLMEEATQTKDVQVVYTATEWLNATVTEGVEHIELRNHVDLTTVDVEDVTSGRSESSQDFMQGIIPRSLKSVRGNCEGPEPEEATLNLKGAPLLPLRPRQCLVIVSSSSTERTKDLTSLWLDGLYFRYRPEPESAQNDGDKSGASELDEWSGESYYYDDELRAGLVIVDSELFLTGVTFQSDGDRVQACTTCGLTVTGHLYAEGTTFANLDGRRVVDIDYNVTTAFLGCNFTSNFMTEAIISASATAGEGSLVTLERCIFSNNTAPSLLQLNDWTAGDYPVFYSDSEIPLSTSEALESSATVPVSGLEKNLLGGISLANMHGSHALGHSHNNAHGHQHSHAFFDRLQAEMPKYDRETLKYAPENTIFELPDFPLSTDPGTGPPGALHQGVIATVVVAACFGFVLITAVVVSVAFRCQRRYASDRNSNSRASPKIASDRYLKSEGSQFDAVSSSAVLPPTPRTIGSSVEVPVGGLGGLEDVPNGFNGNQQLNDNVEDGEISGALSGGISGPLRVTSLSGDDQERSASCESFAPARDSSPAQTKINTKLSDGGFDNDIQLPGMPMVAPSAPSARTNARPAQTEVQSIIVDSVGDQSVPASMESVASEDTIDVTFIRDHMATLFQSLETVLKPGDVAQAMPLFLRSKQLAHNVFVRRDPSKGQFEFVHAETHRVKNPAIPRMQFMNSYEAASPTERLEAQLDWIMVHRNGLLFNDLRLSPTLARRVGGQGVVVFAHHATNTTQQFAVKFFIRRTPAAIEAAAASCTTLQQVLPTVAHLQPSLQAQRQAVRGLPTPLSSWQLPAMLVMERGQSLEAFAAHGSPTFSTTVQVVRQVGERVAALHDAGWVHRNLKPGNVLWMPSCNSWRLVDCASCAVSGQLADLAFTVKYAAPETVRAYQAGHHAAIVDPAVDVWAFGIMCWEVATGQQFYGVGEGAAMHAVLGALVGRAPLPSEERLTPDVSHALGTGLFRQTVLSMLNRDPASRPPLRHILALWAAL